jgi:hypothetical protein
MQQVRLLSYESVLLQKIQSVSVKMILNSSVFIVWFATFPTSPAVAITYSVTVIGPLALSAIHLYVIIIDYAPAFTVSC